MNKIRLFIIYLLTYWVLGSLLFLAVFGFQESWKILVSSPFSLPKDITGIFIFFASFAATAIVFRLKNQTLTNRLYFYLAFGFHVANLSLLILFMVDGLFHITWAFPDFLLIFLVPFIELLFSYMFAFILLAMIPALGSALILYGVKRWSGWVD